MVSIPAHNPERPETRGKVGSGMQTPARMLFLVLPFAGARYGVLGVSTLKGILERDGIESDIEYLNLKLARRMGPELYSFIADSSRGEIFFTPHYFDVVLDEFLEKTLPAYYEDLFESLRDSLLSFRRSVSKDDFLRMCHEICQVHVHDFISECMEAIAWQNYDIIGFSLMFDQTLPALSLARRIKAKFPDKTIVFGGANCDSEMGLEMLRSFACVDVVAIGEADRAITPLVHALRKHAPLDGVPGIAFRRAGEVVQTPTPPLLTDLDTLPIPNYDDYLRQLRDCSDIEPHLYFETSRGCWWGQKHLCSFCGLNANGLAFRRKSPERALQEILTQERRYSVRKFTATDNILDVSYFKTLLPELERINSERPENQRLSFFYEMKSNAKKDHVLLMKRAGVNHAQPGIESFSDHILELMNKGATSMQQIQMVKWATEVGIVITYGVLYGFPGETAADYDEMTAMVDFVQHLQPPMYFTMVALDRFSPYFLNPKAYGIHNIRPSKYYYDIFPDSQINLYRLAYRFAYEHELMKDAQLQAATERCLTKLRQWRNEFNPDTLVYSQERDRVYVLDRRWGRRQDGILKAAEAQVFLHCDHYHSFSELRSRFSYLGDGLTDILDRLVSRKWLYRDRKQRYIALPTNLCPEVPASAALRTSESVSSLPVIASVEAGVRRSPPDPRLKTAPNG